MTIPTAMEQLAQRAGAMQAAAIPEAFATSYLNLCIEGGTQAGDTVLIQAGASGLGMAAIQLVKVFGGTVMTTVGTPEKAAFVRDLGADLVVVRGCDDLAATMARHPVDIALDCVGGPSFGACLAARVDLSRHRQHQGTSCR